MTDVSRISIAMWMIIQFCVTDLLQYCEMNPVRLVAEGGSATEALQIAQLHRPDIMYLI